MTTIARFYPNGEFTQGFDSSYRRPKSRAEKACVRLHKPGLSPKDKEELSAEIARSLHEKFPIGTEFSCPSGTVFLYTCKKYSGGIKLCGYNEYNEFIEIDDPRSIEVFCREEGFSPLVHQTLQFSQKSEPSRKKCLKMTSKMGRNIRNAAYIMEQRYGKDNLSFLTLTLPDLCPGDLDSCNRNWSAITDQFFKWLRGVVESKGGEFQYTYCTEVQSKRLTNRGEYALHLHLLFVGRIWRKRPWYVSPLQCRKAWARCLRRYCTHPFQQSALENLQRVTRSAGAYLSKYISKGSNGFSVVELSQNEELPTIHWGGMSRKLSREIRRRTRLFRGDGSNAEIANAITRCIYSPTKHRAFKFVKTSFISFSGVSGSPCTRGIWVAVGCLRSGLHTSILDDLIADLLGNEDINADVEILRSS